MRKSVKWMITWILLFSFVYFTHGEQRARRSAYFECQAEAFRCGYEITGQMQCSQTCFYGTIEELKKVSENMCVIPQASHSEHYIGKYGYPHVYNGI